MKSLILNIEMLPASFADRLIFVTCMCSGTICFNANFWAYVSTRYYLVPIMDVVSAKKGRFTQPVTIGCFVPCEWSLSNTLYGFAVFRLSALHGNVGKRLVMA